MSVRSRTPIEEAEYVLGRESGVKFVQLLKLLHDVNPTLCGLDESAQRRRYGIKARLQSLLIRRFANQLQVVPGDEPGIVSLLHGHAGADACHAAINELDEDARSWVTYQLDTGNIDEAESATTSRITSRVFNGERATTTQDDEVTRLVAAGQLALAEYDFEQAAVHFQQAQQTSQGAIAPTRVLLEFWIDQVGADQAALELESHLPRATLANADVRALLGIAAARTQDIPRAERLTRGLDGPRAAEVVGLIARSALRTGDPESAVPWITQLRSLDSMHPAIVDCERELRRLRDEERLSAEAELQRLQVVGTLDEIERCANDLLQHWPQSERALSWVRERAAERAGLAAIQALEHAERARECGALRDAAFILGNALAPELAPELRAVLQDKRAEFERQLRESADNERVNEVATSLRSTLAKYATCTIREPLAESGLDAYLELPSGLRERVREQVSRPELEWVEPILTRLGARRAKIAAAAVLALVELRVELEQHSAEALIRLHPHVEVLETMPESSRLVAKARHRVRLQRQALALEQLQQAQQALAESTEVQALCLLESISPEDLDPKGRERKRELLSATHFSLEQTDLENRLLVLLHRQGDVFGAKEIASQLADRTDGDERLAWIGRGDELRDEIARRWCWMAGEGEIGDFWMNGVEARRECTAPEPWIEPGGVTAICFVASGRWLLLIRFQLDTAQVESWVRMMLPKSVESIHLSRITDQVAVLVTDKAEVLVVDHRNWEILAYHESPVSKDWVPATCVVSRDARWLWCAQNGLRESHFGCRVQALEIASRRVVRTFDKAVLDPVVGSHDAEVAVVHEDCISFHRARGGILSGLTVSASLISFVQAPSWHGVVGVIEDDDSGALTLLGPILPGQIPAELVIAGSFSSGHQLAVALDDSLLVARYYADGEQWLEAFIEANGRLASLYRVQIPNTALLLTDRAGRYVWVLDLEKGKLTARRILSEPPRLHFDRPPRRCLRRASAISMDCFCQHEGFEQLVPSEPIHSPLDVWQAVQGAQIDNAVAAPPTTRQGIQRLLNSHAPAHVGALLLCALRWAFPNDSILLLRTAEERIQLDDWAAAYRCLRAVEQAQLPAQLQQHALHLKALCALMGQDFAEARELCQRAVGHKGRCDLTLICEHADPMVNAETALTTDFAPCAPNNQDSAIAVLRRALRDADAFLAEGDPRAAFDAANLPELFGWADERLLACAAESLMQFEPEGVGERLRREYVLSALLADNTDPLSQRSPIPVPEGWDSARIAAIRARAAQQLAVDTGADSTTSTAVVPAGEARDVVPSLDWPPLLAHERLLDLHPGLMHGLDDLLDQLKGDSATGALRAFSEVELLADPRVWRIMEAERVRLVMEGETESAAVLKLTELGPHVAYLVNHCLAGRRGYWVDGSLASLLREPNPNTSSKDLASQYLCHCFAFTDHDARQIADQLLARDRRYSLGAKPITVLTAYVWQFASESDATQLAIRLVFSTERQSLAYLVARELQFDPKHDFDAIVNSHRNDTLEAALDPIIDAPELGQIVRMVLRSILHLASPNAEIRELTKCNPEAPNSASSSTRDRTTFGRNSAMSRAGDQVILLLGMPDSNSTKVAPIDRPG